MNVNSIGFLFVRSSYRSFDGICLDAYNRGAALFATAGEGPLQRGPYEPGQGGNTAAISLRLFVWRPLTGGRGKRVGFQIAGSGRILMPPKRDERFFSSEFGNANCRCSI